MDYRNLYELFRDRVQAHQGKPVFFTRQNGVWEPITWDSFAADVYAFGQALLRHGLTTGKSVCILMKNVPQWPVGDLGTILAGGVGVGLYPTNSAEQCRYIIDHSEAEFVVVDTAGQLKKILSVRHELPRVKSIICLDEATAKAHEGVVSFHRFLEEGREAASDFHRELIAKAEKAGLDDTAIMVYTSGTTGLPKGACLSHRYILRSAESLEQTIPVTESDRSFSYLPYCHVAERISGLYNRLNAGSPAYFVDDLTRLWDYMLEVKPTVFGSLPRFLEKIHARILADVENLPAEEKAVFEEVLQTGRTISLLRQNNEPVPEEIQARYDRLAPPVIQKVKDYFGGEIRITTSGGAPLPREIAEFFDALGVPLLQAYGLTENICVAFNRPDKYRFGTVGPAMPGCTIQIAEDGEIMVRSEMMFSGYFKQPAETEEVLRDGWLYTGDLGELDADGFLKITGRKKELVVTSTGKKVPPALLENLLREHHLISQALAYGDNKSYITALITLNQLETESFAGRNGIAFETFADLTKAPEIRSLVQTIVNRVNERVSSTEAIKKFVILAHDFTVEADEITPTMKVKRKVVSEKYRDVLEGMYS